MSNKLWINSREAGAVTVLPAWKNFEQQFAPTHAGLKVFTVVGANKILNEMFGAKIVFSPGHTYLEFDDEMSVTEFLLKFG